MFSFFDVGFSLCRNLRRLLLRTLWLALGPVLLSAAAYAQRVQTASGLTLHQSAQAVGPQCRVATKSQDVGIQAPRKAVLLSLLLRRELHSCRLLPSARRPAIVRN